MCKLGIEKADYLIDWELLVDAMRKTDFMEKWVIGLIIGSPLHLL